MVNTALDLPCQERVCASIANAIEAAGLWSIPGAGINGTRTHRISPRPFVITARHLRQLEQLGDALAAFYSAANDLYLRSGIDWAREYLDIGKGEEIIRHGLMNYQKRALPRVIRPDILLTDEGFAITELDSVPGGIGQLDCLSAAYSNAGFDLVGGARGMRDGFAGMIRDVSGIEDPVCAIVVSDESSDYLPEMSYLAAELRKAGLRAYAVRPPDIEFTEDGLYIQAAPETNSLPDEADGTLPGPHRLKVDVLYRFFELFDLMNIPKSELVAYAAKKRRVAVTPPYKHFLEEKMLLALLHHDALAGFWKASMGEDAFGLLRDCVVPTYILDSRHVPPHASISGFEWRGSSIRDWSAIKEGTQKERRLVIKPSGFSPLAWGSRGVKVGHDMPAQDWSAAVDDALAGFARSPYVLQPFRDASVFDVAYLDKSTAGPVSMRARVRLCPYYFVIGEKARLGGVLATAVPHNKKLIHGMADAVMFPCEVGKES